MMKKIDHHVLEAKQLRLAHRIAVNKLRIEQGECIVICGPNGSGKSSLLRLLAGLEDDYAGDITVDDCDIRHLNRQQIAKNISLLPQRPQLSEGVTCSMIVSMARYRFMEAPRIATKQANRILHQHGIGHLAERFSGEISGGQLQRVLLAALVAQDTPFLLVDEPANHLDPNHQVSTYRYLGSLWRDLGKSVVIVSHDIRLAQLLGPKEKVRIIAIRDHKIIEDTYLADNDLATKLSNIYEVEFVNTIEKGGLAIHLPAFEDDVHSMIEHTK